MTSATTAGSASGAAAASSEQHGERRRTRAVLVWVCAVVVLARVIYMCLPLRSDEGGYLLAARHWTPGGGEFLYGGYHVDRPPILLSIYRVAALWEWDGVIRLMTIPFVLLAVLALARAGHLLGGHPGGRSAAIVAASLFCTPALGGEQADAGLFAASFVSMSVALTLTACHTTRIGRAVALMWAAGVLAAAAALVKQSFLEGAVFAGALLLAETITRRRVTPRHVAMAAALVLAMLASGAAVAWWAVSYGVDLSEMWRDLVTFRGDALAVIGEQSMHAPAARAGLLVVMAVLSGALPIVLGWAQWLRDAPGHVRPETWAVTAMLALGVLGMAGGGSYWRQYLLELAPAITLAAGCVVLGRGARSMRVATRVAAVSACLGLFAMTVGYALVPRYSYPRHIGHWLAESAAPGDTAFVAYGHPHILESADLPSPYPYLWSLQMRTLDPQQERLRATLTGPTAPTFVVLIDSLNSWAIDESGRTRRVLEHRYRPTALVCGYTVLVRNDVQRHLATPPRC